MFGLLKKFHRRIDQSDTMILPRYTLFNGRRYMQTSPYLLPKDLVNGLDAAAPPGEYIPVSCQEMAESPPNYHFRRHDVFKRLPFANNSFDMVHMRLVSAAIPVQRWEPLLRELVRLARPKGQIELVEGCLLSFSHPTTTLATERLQAMITMLGAQRGIDLSIGERLAALLHETTVFTTYRAVPCAFPWGHTAGILA